MVSNEGRFFRMIELIISPKIEGTLSDDPYDPGGKTIYGIARNRWKWWFDQVYNQYKIGHTSNAKELAIEFYHTNFWNHFYDILSDESLCFQIFDFGINASPHVATLILQQTLNKWYGRHLKEDGIFGKFTFFSIETDQTRKIDFVDPSENESLLRLPSRIENESDLYSLYIFQRDEWYRERPTFWRFGKGWLNRVKLIYNEAKDVNGKVSVKVLLAKAI